MRVAAAVAAVPEATAGVSCQWYQWYKLGHAFKLWSYSVPHSASPPNILLINPFSVWLLQNWVLLPPRVPTVLLPTVTVSQPLQGRSIFIAFVSAALTHSGHSQ